MMHTYVNFRDMERKVSGRKKDVRTRGYWKFYDTIVNVCLILKSITITLSCFARIILFFVL